MRHEFCKVGEKYKFFAAGILFLLTFVLSFSASSVFAEEGEEEIEKLSPGDAPESTVGQMEEIERDEQEDEDGYLDEYGVNRPLDLITDPLDSLYEKTGLRVRFASTSLFMEPLGVSDVGTGMASDHDVMTSWTLLGRGTKDTGTLVVTGEYRHDIGPTSPADLRGEMGTLIAPSNAFNDRGAVVRDFFWIQRFFDARLRMLIGRGDPSDYVGSHRLQNVNNSFVNRHFSANPTVAFPGHGPLVGLSVQPNGEYYVTGGVSNAYSRTDSNETSSFFDEGDYFTFLEAGITPTIEGLGASRLAAGLWHIDERDRDGLPSDEGVTLMFDQKLGSNAQAFARYAYSDAELTNVRQIIQGGFGFHQLFGGSSDTLSGIALSLGIPRLDASENETALELFHRFQLTQNIQLAFGGQSIFDPGNNPDDSVVGVLYSRVRLAF